MVNKYLRTVYVKGENIQIGDILPSGEEVTRILIEDNSSRIINESTYANTCRIGVKRHFSREGYFGNTSAAGRKRVDWGYRIDELQWLLEQGESLEVAMKAVAPKLKPTSWSQVLSSRGYRELSSRIYKELIKQ